ncbi:hypothetical protein Hanom_Chr16g01493471 [Helianthus anomalus]
MILPGPQRYVCSEGVFSTHHNIPQWVQPTPQPLRGGFTTATATTTTPSLGTTATTTSTLHSFRFVLSVG